MLSSLPRRKKKKEKEKENPTEQEPRENKNEINIRYTLHFQKTCFFLYELTWDAVVQWGARTTFSLHKRAEIPNPEDSA